MKIYDFNKSFNTFLGEISISEENRRNLLEAKKILRSEIRKAFNEDENNYVTAEYNYILKEASIDKIKPKFMSQGSFVYGTINYPCNPPTQQMDLDYGIYIPLSYTDNLTDNLTDNFNKASGAIRSIIYTCIENICNSNNWELSKKSKCLRVVISKDSHIDLPIYSIPDEEMETINETMLDSVNTIKASFVDIDKIDNILLATDTGWIKSDPRDYSDKIKEIKKSANKKTFIDMSRYLKAWNDFQYPQDNSELFSIAIMSGVYQLISNIYYTKEDSKIKELSYLVEGLKDLLIKEGIQDLTDETKIIMEGNGKYKDLIDNLDIFCGDIDTAMQHGKAEYLIKQFGDRFPSENSNIIISILASTVGTNANPIKPARDYFDK